MEQIPFGKISNRNDISPFKGHFDPLSRMDKYWHLKLLYIIANGIKQLKSSGATYDTTIEDVFFYYFFFDNTDWPRRRDNSPPSPFTVFLHHKRSLLHEQVRFSLFVEGANGFSRILESWIIGFNQHLSNGFKFFADTRTTSTQPKKA